MTNGGCGRVIRCRLGNSIVVLGKYRVMGVMGAMGVIWMTTRAQD